jgi:hypothetical protein
LKAAEEKTSWQSRADLGYSSGVAMDATRSTARQLQSKSATNNPYKERSKPMSEETKNVCRSYADGHHLHYIAINSASRPRVPAAVRVYGGAAFQVTVEGVTNFWFTHDPQRLLIALAGAKPQNIEATTDRNWLFVKGDYSVDCFNMTTTPLSPC